MQYANAKWARSMGMVMMTNKNTLFVTLVGRITRFYIRWVSFFSQNLIDLLCLQLTHVPRSPDMVIFVSVTTTTTTTMTEPIALPLVVAHGVIIYYYQFMNNYYCEFFIATAAQDGITKGLEAAAQPLLAIAVPPREERVSIKFCNHCKITTGCLLTGACYELYANY